MDVKYLKLLFALREREVTYMTSAFMTGLVDLMMCLMKQWPELVENIRTGTINEEILVSAEMRAKLEAQLRPDPARAEELRREFERGFDEPIVPRIWPDLCCVGTIGGGGFIGHTERMRTFLGPDVEIDFMVYAASEALMAAAPDTERIEYALLVDSCFYEFIPVDSEDDESCTVDQLEVGREYEIVITNQSGFYRYRIKDVVRMLGWKGNLPLISFVYRKNQMLSIAGEKTNDEAVLWSVREAGKRLGCSFPDYCVLPDTDSDPGHYRILLEPEEPIDLSRKDELRDELDWALGTANPSYGQKVRDGILGPLEVEISQMETHALYRDLMMQRGVSGNQLKPVRVLDTLMKERFFLSLIERE